MGGDRLTRLFCDLVRIDSESLREGQLADHVEGLLKSWGCRVKRDGAARRLGSETGNLYAWSSPISRPPTVLLSAHLDTVSPGKGIAPRVGARTVRSDGRGILGADDKAGLAIALELMRQAAQNELGECSLQAIFSVAEEKGILGMKHARRDWIKAQRALVLDGNGYPERVITAAPTQFNLDLIFAGRTAHSGIEPEKGINAIAAAAKGIAGMRLGRIDSLTTANVGMISGGTAVNIVPQEARVRGEVRSHDPRRLERQMNRMIAAAERGAAEVGARLTVKRELAYEGYRIPAGDELVRCLRRAGASLGMQMRTESSGGGSDANQLNAWGIRAVVLNTGAFNPHTEREYLDLACFRRCLELCRQTLLLLTERRSG